MRALPSRRQTLPANARHALVFLLYAVAALACLVIPSYPYVYSEGQPARLLGPDSYFHLRHTRTVLEQYPVVARYDPMIKFPEGEIGMNQGLFDMGLATVIKLSGGRLTPLEVLAWVSPVCLLAAVAVGFLWFLHRRLESCAYLFLLFALLYPGPLQQMAALGQGDHHVFEVMLAMLVAVTLDLYLRPGSSWRWGPLAVLPLFLLYLSWAGGPLHLLLVGAAFYVRAWRKPLPGEALERKGMAYGLALVVLVELSRLWPWSVIFDLGAVLFDLGAVALLAGYPLLVWCARRTFKGRALWAGGLLLAGFVLVLITPLASGAMLGMFSSRSILVAEHVPASFAQLFAWFGPLWLLVLALPWRLGQRHAWGEAVVPVVYGGGLLLFWVITYDFHYYAPLPLAAGAAYVLGTWSRRRLWAALLLAIAVLLPWLSWGVNRPWADPQVLRESVLCTEGMEAACDWLKRAQGRPLPSDGREYGLLAPWDLGNLLSEMADTPVAIAEEPDHELTRLMFSDNPDRVYARLQGKGPLRYVVLPATALAGKFAGEMLAAGLSETQMFTRGPKIPWGDRQVAPLVATARNRASMLCRLYWDLGNDAGHFRLVYETPQRVLHLQRFQPDREDPQTRYSTEMYAWAASEEEILTSLKPLLDTPEQVQETTRGAVAGARIGPEVRIFEIVPGALLEGQAPPGAEVVASLRLLAPTTQRRWTGRWSTRADAGGRFSLRVPYPTTGPLNDDPLTVKARGPYRVTVHLKEVQVSVSAEDVSSEHRIEL